ncbi:MAG: paraquat-inducible protein A [Crocinitomicaceae bacterium]
MKKYLIISILTLLIGITAIVFTHLILESLNQYKQEKETIARELNFEERLMNVSEWNPFSDAAESKLKTYDKLQNSADEFYHTAVYDGLILFGSLIVYLLVVAIYYWKVSFFNQMFGIGLIVVSLCLIYLGLQAPFLEIEAFSNNLAFKIPVDLGFFEHTFEKTFDGKMLYFYQNKSVFELVYLLFSGGNVLVGLALVLFSIVFPLFKLLSSLFVLIWSHSQYANKVEYIILRIGKWSMADVFVAGIFLAYFSFSNMNVGVDTGAATLIGLYFFLGFVIVSIISSYFVKKSRQITISTESKELEFVG